VILIQNVFGSKLQEKMIEVAKDRDREKEKERGKNCRNIYHHHPQQEINR
jgi:hypothetical protein